MTPDIVVRPARASDLAAVLALNEADVSHLSALTTESLERIAALASYFRVAELDGRVLGFLLAISSSARYDSVNFSWFQRRYPRFVYIDRVVVARDARGAGIASRLYDDLERDACESIVACEINLRPPNPQSLAFHEHRGFTEVGVEALAGGAKTVSMRIKRLG